MQTIILLLVDILPQIIQGVSIIFFVTYKKQLKQVLNQIQLLIRNCPDKNLILKSNLYFQNKTIINL